MKKTTSLAAGRPAPGRYRTVPGCTRFWGKAVRRQTPPHLVQPIAGSVSKKLREAHGEAVERFLLPPDSALYRKARGKLLDHTQINGVCIGHKVRGGRATDELAIQVFVSRKAPNAKVSRTARIPKQIGGVRTDVIQRGAFRFLNDAVLPEPLNPGDSVMHPRGGAGTMTCLVARGSTLYILSASHVLGLAGAAQFGDTVDFLPASASGARFPIGVLRVFDDLRTAGTKSMDAAVASTDPRSVNMFYPDGSRISPELATLSWGLPVTKTGRHGVTFGVLGPAMAVENVPLPGGGVVQFVGQVAVRSADPGVLFARSGDSGALVVTVVGNHPVGMLIAGVDNYTLVTPMGTILNELGVRLVV